MSEQSIPENKESYSVATYARRFGLTRQALINDDLDALSDIPRKMGRAARRLPNNLFWTELVSNSGAGPVMQEGGGSLNLFHDNHASGDTSHADALAEAGLATAFENLRKVIGLAATGATAPTLNLTPQFIVVPAALERTGRQLLTDVAATTSGGVNVFSDVGLTLIVEPQLDATSATKWYLVAGPTETDGAEIAFLNGNQQPQQILVEGTNVLGLEWGVVLGVGVKFVGHRGWVRSGI